MAAPKLMTAEEAFELVQIKETGLPLGKSSPFVCPYENCGVFSQHQWGTAFQLTINLGLNLLSNRQYSDKIKLVTAHCESCAQEVVFRGGKLIWPISSSAPSLSPDLPTALVADYEEARQIFHASPRGAAALLRLVIQKLCTILGSTKPDINSAVGEFVADGKIAPTIQRALDIVRVIGNEAVHPGTMDLRDDIETVRSLFELVNFIVQKMISEPREIDAIYGLLPEAKRAGIDQRDQSAT